jgi:Domain of unknown function (DUF4136)
MSRFIRFGFLAVLIVICGACSTLNVNTDFNPTYDFTQLKTYAWLDTGQAPSSDARINNDLIVDRVRAAVEKTLAAKGYVKTESASADFMVSWLGAIDKKLQVESIDHFYSPYGYGALARDPSWGGGMRTTATREYEEGTLVVDILDPAQHKLMWRGTGKNRLGKKDDPEAVTQRINRAIAEILADFPPGQ